MEITTAVFEPESKYAKTTGLWQYDYGQILRLQGLDLPKAVEIHFSLSETGGESVTRIGTTRDGVTDVLIPDSMLENNDAISDYSIFAFVFLTDDKSGNTEYRIKLSVKARPRPEVPGSPEEPELFRETIKEVNQAADRSEEARDQAEAWAHGREDYPELAEDNAKYYASQAADSAAESAKSSEDADKTKADVEKLAESIKQTGNDALKNIQDQEVVSKQNITSHTDDEINRINKNVGIAEEKLQGTIRSAGTMKQDLEESTSQAETMKNTVDKSVKDAEAAMIEAADSAKKDISKAAEKTKEEIIKKIASDENVEKINKNATNIDLLKEDISNKITKFYASNQGETHITDSDNGKIMDMMLYGRSEQKQYSGKNLLNMKKATLSGWNISINIPLEKSKTYTFTNGAKANNHVALLGIIPNEKDEMLTEKYLQPNESSTFTCLKNYEAILLGGSDATTNIDGQYMLELGSEATSYEPYTGGIPSPNPDYPQEIKSVVNPTIKLLGSNILKIMDGEYQQNGLTVTVSNGVVKLKGTANAYQDLALTRNFKMFFKEGTEIIFSPNNIKCIEKQNNSYLDFSNNNTKGFSVKNNNIDVPYIIKKEDTEYSFELYIRCSAGVTYDEIWKPQVLIGETITPFKPYTEQTITLPITLNAIPVSSGGNVTINGQQYISDYVDVERGKLVRYFYAGKLSDLQYTIRVPEDPKWYDASISNSFELMSMKYKGIAFKNGSLTVGFCNKAKTYGFADFYGKTVECGVMNSDGYIIVNLPISLGINTVDLFREWSKECYIIKMLDAPIESNLTAEEISAFKSLATYYPTTNISVNSEQLDGYTVFNYPISMANGWNYVKQQLNDNRDYIYDMDLQSAEAYVNSEYAVALTELEV